MVASRATGRVHRVRWSVTACAVVACVCGGARPALAQPATASPWFAEAIGGAMAGHGTGGPVGAEGGYRLAEPLDLVVEGGHLFDVGSRDLDARAARVAGALGVSASAAYRVSYVDAGVRARARASTAVQPYATLGVGAARVTTDTSFFSANGAATSAAALPVQLGSDLSGDVTKLYLAAGAGVAWLSRRVVVDASYRYGHLVARPGVIVGDGGIDAHRLQIGVGVRF